MLEMIRNFPNIHVFVVAIFLMCVLQIMLIYSLSELSDRWSDWPWHLSEQ